MEATDIAQFTAALSTADLAQMRQASASELCDLLTALELAKNAAAAAQARAGVAVADALRQEAIAGGVAPERADKGIGQQVVWRGGSPRMPGPVTSGLPGSWCTRCRTRMPR